MTALGSVALDLAGSSHLEALLGAAVSLDLNLRHNRELLYLLFRIFGRLGGQEDGHMPSLQLGALVHHGDLAALLSKLQKQVLTDVGVGHLPTAEAHGDFAPVAVGQEFLRVAELDVEIVDVDAGRHPDLLDLHHALILACFLLALGLLEAVLAVIHQLAYRGHSVRRDLHQIQIRLSG